MRTALIVAAIVTLVALAYAAPSVVQLVVIGATVSLVLSFPVRLLSRFMRRGVAILLVMVTLILLSLLALVTLIPFLITELTALVTATPELVARLELLLEDVLQQMWERGFLPTRPEEVLNRLRLGLFDRAQAFTELLLDNVLSTLASTLGLLIAAFGVVFIATYLLVDIRRLKAFYLRSFTRSYRPDGLYLWDTLADSLSRYLGGLVVSITIQGTMAGVALWMIGVPYAALLGLWMAMTAIVPYIGAFVGAAPAVIIALTISFPTAVLTALAYLVINQIEGNFLTPRIQGEAVRVHPLLVFLAIITGAQIAGILGAVLAVPTLAVVRVLADFFAARLRVRPPGAPGADLEPNVLEVPEDDLPKP